MGYDGLFLGRIDYQDKIERFTKRNAEMVWHASDSLGSKADLFTGILYNTYSPPPGFCFDILCSDDPIIDDKSSPEYNVDQKVIKCDFINIIFHLMFFYLINFQRSVFTKKKNQFKSNIVARIFRIYC